MDPPMGPIFREKHEFWQNFQNFISPGFSLFITNSLIFLENLIFAKNVKFRLCQPIFRDFCMSRIFPRRGQGVTLGQGHFFQSLKLSLARMTSRGAFSKILKIFQKLRSGRAQKSFENFLKMLLARMTSRGAFSKNEKIFQKFYF